MVSGFTRMRKALICQSFRLFCLGATVFLTVGVLPFGLLERLAASC